MTEPPKFSLPRWAPLAAVAVMSVAGLAAAAVACRRRTAVAEDPAPPLPVEPPPPPAKAEPGRFRGLLLAAIVAAVVGVWSIALVHNAMNGRECAEAGGRWNPSDSRASVHEVAAYRYDDDYEDDDDYDDAALGATSAAVSCVSRR